MDKQLQKAQEWFFDLFIISTYILLIFSAIGFSQSAPKYLEMLDYYIKIYISLFLVWRFNPLKSYYEFTNLDRKIAFHTGMLILTTSALNQYLEIFVNNVKEKLYNDSP
jgi:purine-cytosine permease-like protein